MKRDYLRLFLILLILNLFLTDIQSFLIAEDKSEAFDYIFSIQHLWYKMTFFLSIIGYGLFIYFILSKYYPKGQKAKYLSYIALGIFVAIGLRYFIQEYLGRELFGQGNYRDDYPLFGYFIDNCFYAIIYGSIGMIYYFVNYSFEKENEKQNLLIQNKATQLQLLKSQINPHFLFNNLNNIYSMVSHNSENALPAIDKLSNLLRYSLYEIEENVTIGEELNQIDNFIDLQKLRSNKKLAYEIETNQIDSNIEIPPFLFFPFVENAFKHGDQHDEEIPIKINIDLEDKLICFSMSNKIKTQMKDEIGGIGLENIKKRLQLLYGDDHIFKISQTNNLFSVNLKIPRQDD